MTQAKLCLKVKFAKTRFMFVTIYENPRRKNFINPPCSGPLKIINWNKNDMSFYFHFPLRCLKMVLWRPKNQKILIKLFWGTKTKCENKICDVFLPLFRIGIQDSRLCLCQTPEFCHVRFLVSRDTEKQDVKDKNEASLLAHCSKLFSTPNFGIYFIIIVL